MLIKRQSRFSGIIREQEMNITQEQYGKFLNGMHAQDAFPGLSADDREFIISGTTPEEWDEVVGTDDSGC